MNRFKSKEMCQAYENALQNFQPGAYGTPEKRKRGASHRCAFWDGFDGQPNKKWPQDSISYANYRAGQDQSKITLYCIGDTMKFNKATKGHDALMGAFISDNGQYKCVKYGEHWKAYFKPIGWVNFGNACERRHTQHSGESQDYKGKRNAIAACKRHFNKYGINPQPYSTLIVR